jgi:hypothetical protein
MEITITSFDITTGIYTTRTEFVELHYSFKEAK